MLPLLLYRDAETQNQKVKPVKISTLRMKQDEDSFCITFIMINAFFFLTVWQHVKKLAEI